MKRAKMTHVYVAALGTNHSKIGASSALRRRHLGISAERPSGFPVKARIVRCWELERAYEVEQEAIKLLREKYRHTRREWFYVPADWLCAEVELAIALVWQRDHGQSGGARLP